MVRRMTVILVVSLLVAASASAMVAWNPQAEAKVYWEKIEKAQREGKHAEVVNLTNQMLSFIDKYDDNYPALKEWYPRVYDSKGASQEKQGHYQAAANTFRDAFAKTRNSGYIDKTMTAERKDLDQQEYYKKTVAFHNERKGIKQEILKIAEQKMKLVNELLQARSITKEQLEKLQAALKDLDGQKQKLENRYNDIAKQYKEDCAPYFKDGIIFNARQSEAIAGMARQTADLANQIFKIETGVREGLVKITEKYEFGWDGLEEKLTKLGDVQKKILELQKKLLDAKPPLSKDWHAQNAELDKLVAENDKLLADIEKAFMDSKTFNKLTPDQQRKYLELFTQLRRNNVEIQGNEKKIDALLKEDKDAQRKLGDVNGDGKIDREDLQAMLKLIFPFPRPFPFFPRPVVNKWADLDGDGKVTMADFDLLNQAVNGDRKFFPVDPRNPRGDMNGDGTFDNDDLNLLAKMILDPKSFAAVFQRIADVNGDGKVDWNDLSALLKKIEEARIKPVPMPMPIGIATGAVVATFTPVATGPAAVVDPATPADPGSGDSSTGIMDNIR